MKNPSRTHLMALQIGLLIGSSALGGIIHLKDGGSVEGDIKKTDDGYRVTSADKGVVTVPSEKVDSIDFKASTGPGGAERGLASLRRAAENLSDIKVILERYKTFIDQNPGTGAAKDAEKDVDQWHDREAQGLVKLGSKWMTPEDATRLQEQSRHVADAVRGVMKQNRLKEAGGMLDKAIADDPQNMSLLYLRGVWNYRQEQLPPARKSFESVITLAADHAPSINNLAVILGRQNANIAALTQYDRAMLAAPGSRDILDNVAEALGALSPEQRKSPVAKKVLLHFNDQDADLQKKMAERGYVRWGATWVDKDKAAQLQEQEKAIKDELDRMSQTFDATQQRINEIDRRIKSDQQQMNLMESQSYATDAKGNSYRLPLPPQYYDFARDVATLQSERSARALQLEQLRRDAKTVQQKLPVPRYSGIQKIIDVDGMPVVALALPGGTPDTRPIADAPLGR